MLCSLYAATVGGLCLLSRRYSFWGVGFWRRYSHGFHMEVALFEMRHHASNYPPQHQHHLHLQQQVTHSLSLLSSLHIRALIPSLSFTIGPFQANESAKGTFFSLLSSRGNSHLLFDFVQSWSTLVVSIQLMFLPEGVSQLKEKWTEYNQPKRLRRVVSLFVSATAKHVAVAAGNRITILSKEDDYQNPCAIFTSEIYLFVYLISFWNLFSTE